MADRTELDRTVDIVSAAATREAFTAAGRQFPDPLLDSYSLAAAALDQSAREPDPEVERDLTPGDAIAVSSGIFTRRLLRVGRWWDELSGPVVAGEGAAARAILPRNRGAVEVRGRRGRRLQEPGAVPEPADVLTADIPDLPWRRQVTWSLRRQRRTVIGLVALSLLGGLAGLLLPLATAALFSYALPSGNVVTVAAVLVTFALGSVGAAAVLLSRNLNVLRLRDISDSILATGVMAHTLRLPLTFFRRMTTGDLLNRLLAVEQGRALVDDGVPTLILTAAFSIANLFILIAINPGLALLVTVVIGLVVAATLFTQVRARRSLTELLQSRADSDSALLAIVASIVPIRVAGAEERALGFWAARQARAVDAMSVRVRRLAAQAPLLVAGPLVVNLVLVLVVVALGTAVIPLTAFMTAYAAVVQLTIAMSLLTQNLVHLWELGPSYERMAPLVTALPERPHAARRPGPLAGAVTLTDVTFGYESGRPPLFEGLNLAVTPGEFVAIVGPSGSGKSTLLRLILGFESPWRGVVTVDGKDLADLDVTAVRRQIGTVLQSAAPFGDTVRDCIRGPLTLSDDDVRAVLAACGLPELAEAPAGLDTVVGPRGSSLSGGQRQRLMIARALACRPRMLLFDEATSALDNVTQEIVMREVLARAVTRIVVAHRLSTVERADRVIVVADGRIVESGAPGDLRSAGGTFARLVARQEL